MDRNEWDQTIDSIEMDAQRLARWLRKQGVNSHDMDNHQARLVFSLLNDIEHYWDAEIERRSQQPPQPEDRDEETLPY